MTLVNAHQRNLYYQPNSRFGIGPQGSTGGVGGLVISPMVSINCAYPEDGNSMSTDKSCSEPGGNGATCIPGCFSEHSSPSSWCNHGPLRADDDPNTWTGVWSCPFPPNELREALTVQQRLQSMRIRNNEIIVNAASYMAHLPHTIEVFFTVPSSGPKEHRTVRGAREALLREYGLGDATGPPLVVMDLQGGGSQPFHLMR